MVTREKYLQKIDKRIKMFHYKNKKKKQSKITTEENEHKELPDRRKLIKWQ